MRPILVLHTDGGQLDRATMPRELSERFELTADELTEMLPSGNQRRFDNRVGWSITHLAQAELLERPRRG
ncbi:MAG: winged helix-turn-helix domain-containing protein [Nitriliruptor sp.]|uniref:winged helix-turn-helix domain-containing protein n=1 Tax=Nitriliruptor sp. TaxID=2448056 RepID=UPI00349FDABA